MWLGENVYKLWRICCVVALPLQASFTAVAVEYSTDAHYTFLFASPSLDIIFIAVYLSLFCKYKMKKKKIIIRNVLYKRMASRFLWFYSTYRWWNKMYDTLFVVQSLLFRLLLLLRRSFCGIRCDADLMAFVRNIMHKCCGGERTRNKKRREFHEHFV